jgi:hypothetical protein
MTPEAKVKKQVRELLRELGIWYYQPMQNGMGQVGIPDFICCWKSRFLAVETKAPGKRGDTTANQDRILEQIDSHGGLCIVVDDVSQLVEFLGEFYEYVHGPEASLPESLQRSP